MLQIKFIILSRFILHLYIVFINYQKIGAKVLWFISCIGCVYSTNAQVPTIQDCLGALPVCQNVYSESRSPSGEGNYTNEIFTGTSCLNDGETNSIWYTFTVNKTGNFGFLITPNDLDDDYDWALYNITNASCSDIISDQSIMVSCNAAGDSACHGPTGATGGSNSNFQGYGCNRGNSPENALVPVEMGNTYVLLINNWTGSVNGYMLDFSLSDDIGIIDMLDPTVNSMTTQQNNQFTIQFSENIQCESIAPENFDIIGEGGPYEIQLIESPCLVGARYGQQFTFSISPPLINGEHTIQMNPNNNFPVVDVCDNPSMPEEVTVTINFCENTTELACNDGLACTQNDSMVVDRNDNSVVCTPCAGKPNGGCGVGATTEQACDDNDNSTENDIEIVLTCDGTVCEPCEGTPICNDLIEQFIFICPGDSARLLDGSFTTIPENYSFTFTNQAGCDSVIVEQVSFLPAINISIADTVYGTIDEILTLETVTNANLPVYEWSPANSLSCFNCPAPMVNTQQTGIQLYSVNITDDETGCSNMRSFIVKISLPNAVFIPNAFSPNQDGQNDEFVIRFQGNLQQFDLFIYNSWGQQIYQGNLNSAFWDGTYQNEKLPIGVYVYFIRSRYINGEQVFKKGNITLIR